MQWHDDYASRAAASNLYEVEYLVELIDLFFNDYSTFSEHCSVAFSDLRIRKACCDGYISLLDAIRLIQVRHPEVGDAFNYGLVRHAMTKLSVHGFLYYVDGTRSHLDGTFAIQSATKRRWSKLLGRNAICGPTWIIEQYRRSIPFIEISNTKGDLNLGTAFLVSIGAVENSGSTVVAVTSKHVCGPSSDNTICRIQSTAGPIEWGELYEHPTLDLCLIRVFPKFPMTTFAFSDTYVLSQIFAMGYPKIGKTKDAYLISSSGQVNGMIDSQDDEHRYFIFTANVAPGQSGGPILNALGQVVGIVTENREIIGQTAGENHIEKHHCAIESQYIGLFIESVFNNFVSVPMDHRYIENTPSYTQFASFQIPYIPV